MLLDETDDKIAKRWATALVLGILRLRYHTAIHAWQPRVELAESLDKQTLRAAMEAVIALGLDRSVS